MTPEYVIDFARSQGYETARPLGRLLDFKTYEPLMAGEGVHHIGLPLFIIDEGGICRMSTPEEAFDAIPVEK